MTLQGKEPLAEFSYQPERVREMEKAGVEIYDIVTSGKQSPELRSWADWFESIKEPCFTTPMDKARGQCKIWIRRTVDADGVRIKKAPAG